MSEEEKSAPTKAKSEKKKISNIWVIDTSGKPSISATFAVVAFFTTSLAYVTAIFESVGGVTFRAFDTAACGAYMIPILSLYFGRRWTEKSDAKKED